MKLGKPLVAALIFTGTLGALNNVLAADGTLEKDPLTAGAYCHQKFAAIRPSTLGDNEPAVKSAETGDVIDFYGPCDETPTGKDQLQDQRRDNEQRREFEYSD